MKAISLGACLRAEARNHGRAMNKDVALLNIEHFRKRLSEETDETRRQMLLQLLAEEEAKLAKFVDPPAAKEPRRQH
jgi:hypothetical protein